MDENSKAEIGQRIRMAREKLGIGQKELAKRLNKTQNAISSYECGNRLFRISELPDFAEQLDVPIAYFFGEDYPDQEVIRLLKQLSPPFRAGILIFLQQYVAMQERLYSQFTEITDETVEEATEFVNQSKDAMSRDIRRIFQEEMMKRVFGQDDE